MARKQKIVISVIGGSSVGVKTEELAEKVGAMIAELGCTLVCGGLGGVMEAAAKGAKKDGEHKWTSLRRTRRSGLHPPARRA